VSPGVGTRHLESPEEIQMYCSDSIHIYRAVYEVHMYIYILEIIIDLPIGFPINNIISSLSAGLQVEVWTNCLFFSFNVFFLSQKEKKKM